MHKNLDIDLAGDPGARYRAEFNELHSPDPEVHELDKAEEEGGSVEYAGGDNE